MENMIYLIPAAAVLALLFALLKSSWVSKQDAGNDKMKSIADNIHEGAMAFLNREYRVLAIFVVVVAILLAVGNRSIETSHTLIGVSFVFGAICSGLAGFFGMKIATKANVRTTNAAREGLNPALGVAFSGGTVMGMSVVGLGVLGLSVLYIVYTKMYGGEDGWTISRILQVLSGFPWALRPSRCSRASAAASTPRRPTWAPIWWARSRPAFPRTTPATPR